MIDNELVNLTAEQLIDRSKNDLISEAYTLDYKDIVLKVKNNAPVSNADEYVSLIKGISGSFESGKLHAVMGPSGSCKTTFMNVLAGRVEPSSLSSGNVLFRGARRDINVWKKQLAYLEQDDLIYPTQTAREYIIFSATCRGDFQSNKDMLTSVDTIIEQLHIRHIRNTCLESVSGGERKRVMIAAELLAKADILILDEPTSGLDSHLAIELIDILKTYATVNNKIVITTVHQPGSGLFNMFDTLLFLYKGVSMISGPLKNSEAFLANNGFESTASLSTSEMLFELFAETSAFPKIRDYKPAVKQLYESRQEKQIDVTTGSSSHMYLDKSLNLKHILALVKRILVLDGRPWKGCAYLLAYLIDFIILTSVISYIALINESYGGSFTKISELGKKLFEISMRANNEDPTKFNMENIYKIFTTYYLIVMLNIPNLLTYKRSLSIFKYPNILRNELVKGTYTESSLYVSAFLASILTALPRYVFMLICFYVIGLGAYLAPVTYGVAFGYMFLTVLTSIFATTISVLPILAVFVKIFLGNMMLFPPPTITDLSNSMLGPFSEYLAVGVGRFIKGICFLFPLLHLESWAMQGVVFPFELKFVSDHMVGVISFLIVGKKAWLDAALLIGSTLIISVLSYIFILLKHTSKLRLD